MAAEAISAPLSNIFNKSIKNGQFPDDLKDAEVSPLFKKDDPFIKKNYRPVSILNSHSKIFESFIHCQLSEHIENIINNYLAAFRKGFGCQTTLLRLADLSKAFDCLPHDLIVDNLAAYGLCESACKLLASYLSNRKQRVKLGDNYSD